MYPTVRFTRLNSQPDRANQYHPSRYLRATKWNQQQAIERLEATLKWRREYGFYDNTMTADHVEPEVTIPSLTRTVSVSG